MLIVVSTGSIICPRFIINFPTKRHYRNPSRIDDIRVGHEIVARAAGRAEITDSRLMKTTWAPTATNCPIYLENSVAPIEVLDGEHRCGLAIF